jgi:hypothetical protein
MGGENCEDRGDYLDSSLLVELSTIEVFMVAKKAEN